jgi:hypothetical protein
MLKKTALLVIALSSVISSFGFSGKTLEVKIAKFNNTDNYSLVVNNKNATNLIIKIFNNDEEVIFSEMIQNVEQFYKVYNLSTLPKGSYRLLINNNLEEESINIMVHQLKGSHPDLGNHMVVGFSKMKDRKISAFIQNKFKNNVSIKLYNNLDEEINTIATTRDGVSKQLLDLSSLKPGKYKLKVSDGQSIFSTNLVIN